MAPSYSSVTSFCVLPKISTIVWGRWGLVGDRGACVLCWFAVLPIAITEGVAGLCRPMYDRVGDQIFGKKKKKRQVRFCCCFFR